MLHSALPLLVHLSSISGLRKWDIRIFVGVKLLTWPYARDETRRNEVRRGEARRERTLVVAVDAVADDK